MNCSNCVYRIISSIGIATTVIGIMIASSYVRMLMPLCTAVLISAALFELNGLFHKKNISLSLPLTITCSSLFLLANYIAIGHPSKALYPMSIGIISMIIYSTASFHRTIDGSLATLSANVFSFIYITIPIVWMMNIYFIDQAHFWFIFLILTAKGCDIAAYFFGKLIGSTLLAPTISPLKTIEGAICGVTASSLIAMALSLASPIYLPTLTFCLLGTAIGIAAILGDLAESLLKRDAQVKDSSSLPGLGGCLDLIDSLIFATVTLFIFIQHI